MKRWSVLAFLSLCLPFAACGDDDDTMPSYDAPMGGDGGGADAAPRNCKVNGGADCFDLPTMAVKVNPAGMMERAANFNCAKETIVRATMPITVTGKITDFQTDSMNRPNATLGAFYDLAVTGTPVATATSDASGNYTITLPLVMGMGAPSRMSWKSATTNPASLDTYALNAAVDTTMAMMMGEDRRIVSMATATTIPAILGVTRTPGTGIIAGFLEDCDGENVRHAIMSLSTTSSAGNTAPTHVGGAPVFYFAQDLPAARTSQPDTNTDGAFVFIQVPVPMGGQKYYAQAWGFVHDTDVMNGMAGLKLLAEFEVPVLGDSVIALFPATPTQGPLP